MFVDNLAIENEQSKQAMSMIFDIVPCRCNIELDVASKVPFVENTRKVGQFVGRMIERTKHVVHRACDTPRHIVSLQGKKGVKNPLTILVFHVQFEKVIIFSTLPVMNNFPFIVVDDISTYSTVNVISSF